MADVNRAGAIWERGDSPASILVAVGDADEAAAAIQVARVLGRALNATLYLLHVEPVHLTPAGLLHHLGLQPEAARGLILLPVTGEPATAIAATALQEKSLLVIMGLPGRPPDGGHTVSTIVESVLTRTTHPVLLVPEQVRPDWGQESRILLPVDGSPSTMGVVPTVRQLAERMSAALDVLYVADHPSNLAESGTMHLPRFVDAPQYEWWQWREEFLSRCGLIGTDAEGEPPDVTLTVGSGDPVQAVLARSRDAQADLIALAWHGSLLHGRARTLKAIVWDSRIPILILRIA